MRRLSSRLAPAILLVTFACSTTDAPVSAVVAGRDDNLTLGNFSGATTSIGGPSNYLLVRDQYTLSLL